MKWSSCLRLSCAGLTAWVVLAGAVSPSSGQEDYRKLAPGVMTSVDPMRQVEETFSRHDVVELLAVEPRQASAKYHWAREVPFRRDVWALEFKFKPVRMIRVDIPQASGLMQRKLLWYMVYSVTNSGKAMHPEEEEDGTYTVVEVDKPVRFIPEFLLYSPEFVKAYPDRVIPAAMGPIRTREDPRRTFYNSVEMAREIPVGQTVWGVAIWEHVDPFIDRFSIYVTGLTNAYKWKDDPASYDASDPLRKDRQLLRKTLKLNFWRPGDERDEHEEEIRYGIPGEVDYQWVYVVKRGFPPSVEAGDRGVQPPPGQSGSGN